MSAWHLYHPFGDQVDFHVVPVDDLREHELAPSCWCTPLRDAIAPKVISHNALDQREKFETGERKPS